MTKDVVVVVKTDAKPRAAEDLDILLIYTGGERDLKLYRDLEVLAADFPPTPDDVDYEQSKEPEDQREPRSKIYRMASALFEQGKTTLADKLIRKVRVVGVEAPTSTADMISKIDALRKVDDDWYLFATDQETDAYHIALSAYAESTEPTEAELGAGVEDHRKVYFFSTANKEISITSRRSIGVVTTPELLREEPACAYVGSVGPFYPQSVTWKFKRPQGITVPDFTDPEREALEEAKLNFLTREYKREYMKNGTCCDGEYIDVMLGADYIAQRQREEIYDVLTKNATVPYTDDGFALIASAVFAALNRATDLGIISIDPESGTGVYIVNVPRRAQATEDECRERRMPDIAWEGLLAGAVHTVKATGTLRAYLNR